LSRHSVRSWAPIFERSYVHDSVLLGGAFRRRSGIVGFSPARSIGRKPGVTTDRRPSPGPGATQRRRGAVSKKEPARPLTEPGNATGAEGEGRHRPAVRARGKSSVVLGFFGMVVRRRARFRGSRGGQDVKAQLRVRRGFCNRQADCRPFENDGKTRRIPRRCWQKLLSDWRSCQNDD